MGCLAEARFSMLLPPGCRPVAGPSVGTGMDAAMAHCIDF